MQTKRAYQFTADYAVPTPYAEGDMILVEGVSYTVTIDGCQKNKIKTVQMQWSETQADGVIGYVPVQIVSGSASCNGRPELGEVTLVQGAAQFLVAGEVAGATWGPFKNIATVNLDGDADEGEIDIDMQTLVTDDIGQANTKLHYEIGLLSAPGDLVPGGVTGGKGLIEVGEDDLDGPIEVDPIKVAKKVVVRDFSCNMRLDLFRKTATGASGSGDPQLSMELDAEVIDDVGEDDQTLAQITLTGFSASNLEVQGDWQPVSGPQYERLNGYIRLTPNGVESGSQFSFNAETWEGTFINFTAGLVGELVIGGEVFSTLTTGIDEDGKGSTTLSLLGEASRPTLNANSFTLSLEDIGIKLDANLLDVSGWSLLPESSAEAYLDFKLTILNNFIKQTGSNDPGVFLGKITFSSDGVLEFTVTTNALEIKIGDNYKIDVTNFELSVQANTGEQTLDDNGFNLWKVSLSGSCTLPLSGAEANLTFNAFVIQDGTLETIDASGSYVANGFTFEITKARYTGSSSGGDFEFEAKVEIKKSGQEILTAQGWLAFNTGSGIGGGDLSITLDNTAPVTGSGDFTASVDNGSWDVTANVAAQIEGFANFSLDGAAGYDADADFYHVYAQVALSTENGGVPMGPSGLFLKGGSVMGAYHRKVNFGELPELDPEPNGSPPALSNEKMQNNHAFGFGVFIAPANNGIIDVYGGLGMALGDDSAISGSVAAWLGGGLAYGSIQATWTIGEPKVTAAGQMFIKLPKGSGEDAGKWLDANATAEAAFGEGAILDSQGNPTDGVSWYAKIPTVNADLFHAKVKVNGEAYADSTGSGYADGSVVLDETITYNRTFEIEQTGTSFSLDGVNLSAQVRGTGKFSMQNWIPDEVTGNLRVRASGSGTGGFQQSTWFGTISGSTSMEFKTGGSQNNYTNFDVSYDGDTKELGVSVANMSAWARVGIISGSTPSFDFDIDIDLD